MESAEKKKPGRPRKHAETGNRSSHSVWLTEQTRAKVIAEAERKRISMSEEMAARIEQSFAAESRYGEHNAYLGDLVAMIASTKMPDGSDWRTDVVTATYVFTRIRRALAGFMGAVENPSSIPVLEESDNRLLAAATGAKTKKDIARLRMITEAGEQDEDVLLQALDQTSLIRWRQGSNDKPKVRAEE